MQNRLLTFLAGLITASAYHKRREIAREWRWACRDLADWRVELRAYVAGH